VRTVLLLQARLDSTRLPGKALLPIAGLPMLSHAMRSLKLVKADAYVLATDTASAAGLAAAASACGFELFIGPKEDVLGRFCQAARAFKADRIIRATGDNPLVSFELANLLAERRSDVPADYSGYLGMPKGMGVEIIEVDALFEAERLSTDPFEREHVAPYLYRRPERFRIDQPMAPGDYLWEKGNVSVDTREDYERVISVFDALYKGEPPRALEVVAWLKGGSTA
jgi:spore coat polysaccharide biosynthesis protein SpsF